MKMDRDVLVERYTIIGFARFVFADETRNTTNLLERKWAIVSCTSEAFFSNFHNTLQQTIQRHQWAGTT